MDICSNSFDRRKIPYFKMRTVAKYRDFYIALRHKRDNTL